MRTGTIVLAAYFMCVVVSAIWRLMPGAVHIAIPDVGALTAAYLGLTARRSLAPAVGGSIVLGYFVDLISGAPPGFYALVLGLTGLVARAVQQRIYVRGAAMTIGFSGFVALVAHAVSIGVRAVYRVPIAAAWIELRNAALVAIATALTGALVWKVFRRIDATYARTHRDRDAALEGIT